MIRDEIEEQFQTVRVKDLSELLQLFSSAQRVANPIARNRERRARKIRVSPLRRNLAETVLQTSIGQGLGAAFILLLISPGKIGGRSVPDELCSLGGAVAVRQLREPRVEGAAAVFV